MKSMRSLLLAAALLAAMPLAGEAQQPEARRGAPQQREMAGRFFERHRAELGLSDQQVAQLEQITTRLRERNAPLMERFRAAMPERGRGERRRPTEEEREAMRARREELRPVMEQMRENRRQAMEESRAVLTQEQRDKLRTMMEERRARGERGGRGGHQQHQPQHQR